MHDRFALLKGSSLFEIGIGSRKPRENKIDHTFRTTLTIAHDDSVNALAPLLLVRIECSDHVVIGSRKLYAKQFRINPSSRTLLVEVDVDNSAGKLLPGAYAVVHFELPGSTRSVTIPSNALLFRSEGLRVGVVRNGVATLVPITIGRDYGDRVEVLTGLLSTDQVILDPSDALTSGTAVQLASTKSARAG